MAQRIELVVYPATDLEKAKAVFNVYLGVEPYVDSAYYVGYRLGEMEVGLDPNGEAVVGYTDVANLESSVQELLDAGATSHQEIKDVGGGLLIAQVKDANGNVLGLRQPPK